MRRALAGFRFMLASRGWRRGFYRAWLIWRRFGLTRRRMEQNLRCLVEVLERHDAKATLFVPGTVLEAHRQSLETFRSPRIEWGIHSDYHTDLSRMTAETQRQHTTNAVRLFRESGWPFQGFRAPYLKTNEATEGVLAKIEGLVYDSSPCVLWEEIYGPDEPSYDWAGGFYRPALHGDVPAVASTAGALTRIPVSLPDDDMLIDRDQRDPEGVYQAWCAMLDGAHARDEVFVLQLHPERGCELADVLARLLTHARTLTPPVWTPTLAEVALHASTAEGSTPAAYRGAFCITGDLDAMAIRDFLARLKSW